MNADRRRGCFSLVSFGWPIMVAMTNAGCRNASDDRVTIVVSGDTAGWITPCGCASNQSGGLMRRATLLRNRADAAHLLYLDAGGSASGTTEYQQLKLAAILRGLKAMALAAHNIGAPEAALEPSQLVKLAEQTGVVWVSANLQPTTGESPAKRCVVIERGGLRIAVTGVVNPALVDANNWTAREPVNAILDAMQNVQADVRVVLAYFDEGGLRSLAQSLPEVDFIIGGPTGQAMKPAAVGPVTVMSATNKGKFLARIQLRPTGGKKFETIESGPIEVVSDLVEDTAQSKNLADYYDELGKRDFTAKEAGLVANRELGGDKYRIAGSDSCAKCHEADQAAWHASRHSHAFEVLIAKQAHVDPFCQQCHTTGYGYDGGFLNNRTTPTMVHVGCENCHGPSSAHVENPKNRTPFLAREQCIRCHDHENSPQFAFDAYWKKISHGGNATAAAIQNAP